MEENNMPTELREKLDFLVDKANKRIEKSKTIEEKIEAQKELEAVKSVYNAYTFNYKIMEKLS